MGRCLLLLVILLVGRSEVGDMQEVKEIPLYMYSTANDVNQFAGVETATGENCFAQ